MSFVNLTFGVWRHSNSNCDDFFYFFQFDLSLQKRKVNERYLITSMMSVSIPITIFLLTHIRISKGPLLCGIVIVGIAELFVIIGV